MQFKCSFQVAGAGERKISDAISREINFAKPC